MAYFFAFFYHFKFSSDLKMVGDCFMVQWDFLSYHDMTVGYSSIRRWFNFYLLKFPKKAANFYAKHRISGDLLKRKMKGNIISI